MRSEEWWKGRTEFGSAPYLKGYYSADFYSKQNHIYGYYKG